MKIIICNSEYAFMEVPPGTVVISGLPKEYYGSVIMSAGAALNQARQKENERDRFEAEAGKTYYFKWTAGPMQLGSRSRLRIPGSEPKRYTNSISPSPLTTRKKQNQERKTPTNKGPLSGRPRCAPQNFCRGREWYVGFGENVSSLRRGSASALRRASHDADAAIIGHPHALAQQGGGRERSTSFRYSLAARLRDSLQEPARRTWRTTGQAFGAAFERSGPVEHRGPDDLQAVALQQRGVFSNAGEKPGVHPAGTQAHLLQGIPGRLDDGLNIAPPPEFRHEASAGFEGAGNRRGGIFGRPYPMQRGVGKDRVELGAVGQRAQVLKLEWDLGEVAARLLHHGGRTVHTQNLRPCGGDLGGELAGAAARVQDALAGLRRQHSEHLAPTLPYEGVAGLVQAGVPIGGAHGVGFSGM